MRKVLGSTGSGAVCQVRITGWKHKLPRCHGLKVTDHNSDPCPQMIGIKGVVFPGSSNAIDVRKLYLTIGTTKVLMCGDREPHYLGLRSS